MKILILGSDGYIGYPLTIHLLKRGHKLIGIDNYSRRARVMEVGSDSLTPITSGMHRIDYLMNKYDKSYDQIHGSLGKPPFNSFELCRLLRDFQPDCIVHLAEMPSAPWSMVDCNNACITQQENVLGTLELLWAMKLECSNAHLLKLGTMGEYGTPDCDIPEGFIPERCIGAPDDNCQVSECPMQGLLFPRQPGSFYHLSKVHDTYNIHFACRNWGLRSTDIMQGVVFGLVGEDDEITRFDYDECFGTAINRFCAQAIIGHPLTVYGLGEQTRGFLTLGDSIKCLTIAIENPPEKGEYRTLNQFENIYTVNQLATFVQIAVLDLGIKVDIDHLPNPRFEAEKHYYNPVHRKLFDLGYIPDTDIEGNIRKLIQQLYQYKDRVKEEVIMPTTTWK